MSRYGLTYRSIVRNPRIYALKSIAMSILMIFINLFFLHFP